MASVNKVILIGNCGRDPEVRYAPSGTAICNVSIATSSRRKDKASGETIEDTQWHRITFYDRLAEIAGEFLKKGRPVYVEGRLKYGKYTDKDGIERNTVDIVATEMQLLGGRESTSGDGDESSEQGGPRGSAPSAPAPARMTQDQRDAMAIRDREQRARQAPAPAPRAPTSFDDMEDDIPF
jgi:single-strand DNA-binding protein